MPIDWSKYDAEIDAAIERAADKTDEKLASRISSLTSLTDAEVIELFPDPGDVGRLRELMKIVGSAEDRNNKINKIVTNIGDFAGVVLSLLSRFR